jgi:hypothetical protein
VIERKMNMAESLSRRHFLRATGCGFGALAWSALASEQALAEAAGSIAHFVPRAKRVIFLFMQGGVSQVDSFDYKPRLARDDGKKMPFDDARLRANTGTGDSSQRVMQSPWRFAQHGDSGCWVSELFPETARHVDRLCVLRGLHTEGIAHGPATLFLHCGATTQVRPSMGSWILYGLGRENQNLPGFITISPSAGNGGARNYGSAFLPAEFQGTAIGKAGSPAQKAIIHNLASALPASDGRRQLDRLQALNAAQRERYPHDGELEAAIRSYELAWRMQHAAPEVLDVAAETPQTLARYGIGEKATDNFGRQCLLARRFCEQHGKPGLGPALESHQARRSCTGGRQTDCRPAFGLGGARLIGRDDCVVGRRIWPHALRGKEWHRPRSQPGRFHGVVMRRRFQARHLVWPNR